MRGVAAPTLHSPAVPGPVTLQAGLGLWAPPGSPATGRGQAGSARGLLRATPAQGAVCAQGWSCPAGPAAPWGQAQSRGRVPPAVRALGRFPAGPGAGPRPNQPPARAPPAPRCLKRGGPCAEPRPRAGNGGTGALWPLAFSSR